MMKGDETVDDIRKTQIEEMLYSQLVKINMAIEECDAPGPQSEQILNLIQAQAIVIDTMKIL